ncbi:sensor histidine kinase [Planotetraspora phitsanulokensis]|uniref:sensor histidine kinase n=1 Tax=Planotetraspora phitsanulokensis TaxID=575192 RepID=UPI00194FBA8F|nr:HAMP domain-containing sensor histidine kinase [Planotetraspora phitsanulokensis]
MVATLLMFVVSHLATSYLARQNMAIGGRVAARVEQGQFENRPVNLNLSHGLQVVDAHGRVAASTPKLRGKPAMATFIPDGNRATASIMCGGAFPPGSCYYVVAQRARHAGENWVVYSASPVIPPWIDPLLAALVAGGAVLLASAATYVGYRFATASLNPVKALRAELDEINPARPGRRVSIPSSDDELHDLAVSVNKFQTATDLQRQFVFDASHGLRSPMATMRAAVLDALYAPTKTTAIEVGFTVLDSLDRMQAITHDLLTLASLDAEVPGARHRINLADLVIAENRIRRASVKKIEGSLDHGVMVIGDPLRLGRLLSNLLDNAERHAKSRITITLRREPTNENDDQRFPDGAAVLEVLDDGAGIDPDKRELVFQRFIRLDAAHNKDAAGTGLGLPIARQFAEASGGTLRIEDSARGARLVLRLPLCPAATNFS